MPALPVITNVFRCAFNWTDSDGQTAVNVIHIRDESGAAVASDVMEGLDDAVSTAMWGQVVPSASVTDVGITPLDGIHATSHFAPATPGNWTGQNGTDFNPAVAAIIKLTTGLRGRSHRGRVFLPFQNEGAITAGFLGGSSAVNYTNGWEAFRTALTTDEHPFTLVVASYKLAQANAVISLVCELPMATQRRRQGRLRGA